MKSQNDKAKIDAIADAQSRITDCENKIGNLEVKFSELEKTIEQQAMQIKRARNMVILKTGEFFKMALHEKDSKKRNMEAESAEKYATNSFKLRDLQRLLDSISQKGTQASFWMDLGMQLGFSKKELDDISRTS
jgi:predicted RNase H-like nuclease (RuvC/YqgF family)